MNVPRAVEHFGSQHYVGNFDNPWWNSEDTYHHRQETRPVKTPPKRGPTTLPAPKVAPIIPVNAGLSLGGAAKATMV
jgi:hypothetical protein